MPSKTTVKVCFVISMTITLSTAMTNANASIKQWPLHSKGEIRYLKIFKVYDIGLYTPNKVTATNILNTNISKCLKLDYAVDLTEDKFRLATSTILQRQHSSEYLEKISGPLEQLQQAYKAVNKGDVYILCYNGKNKIISLELNTKKLIEIQSAELAKAYMGIWLSDNQPISMHLYQTFFSKKIQN